MALYNSLLLLCLTWLYDKSNRGLLAEFEIPGSAALKALSLKFIHV